MSTTAAPTSSASAGAPSARERLLAAADELFYAEGVHTVGIDRIIEHAGVAKASLYNAFGSKDELVRAYLERRRERRKQRITDELARHRSPRAKVLSVFDILGRIGSAPGYRGCAFYNASAESTPDAAAVQVNAEQRAWTRALFTGLVREAGVRRPDALAAQLVLLYDGATASMYLDHDPSAAAAAKAAAAVLLDAAT
ncbi:MAG TPA: TetR/AcrR family transcriptional regulator [Actinomycetes bacterium]|jgi:AcrR family transcriptional regulator|nr:TetR/AcrR family transcriptional regulator [Actinomycetes bacterium]